MAFPVDRNSRAIVDMGSNGIRLSITDLANQKAGILSTSYQERVALSLYDAQFSTETKAPIPRNIIDEVVRALVRFKRTCREFDVREEHIRVLATEATREAINSAEFREDIKQATGWQVDMLSKEEEGRLGAMGIACSVYTGKGLALDMGGGSVQLTWIEVEKGDVKVGKSASLPYGAAALSKRQADAGAARDNGIARRALESEVKAKLTEAVDAVLGEPAVKQQNIGVFLSGGGFRGWGNVLMEQHSIEPYPIPIINGFQAELSRFINVSEVEAHVQSEEDVFRISKRRARQIPAVAFFISALLQTVPNISSVRFCQGGVREGVLYSELPKEVRAIPPLKAATQYYATNSADIFSFLFLEAVSPSAPDGIKAICAPLANVLFMHTSFPREARAAAALRCTTTGELAGGLGVLHEDRAALALALCERWDGELSRTDRDFRDRLVRLAGARVAWWAALLGRVAGLVAWLYPSADAREERIRIRGALQENSLRLEVGLKDDEGARGVELAAIEKLGWKKNWVGGKEGWGMKVVIEPHTL